MSDGANLRVLFLCTGNSCRSQMSLGFARHYFPAGHFYSAGTAPAAAVNPRAVVVMREKGVDVSRETPQHLIRDVTSTHVPLDYVVTVCGGANEACPVFRTTAPYTDTKIVHVGFDDPPALIDGIDDEEARLDVFRRVRDEIEAWIKTLPDTLPKKEFK